MKEKSKSAIALLITLLFIIAITVSLGISLRQVKQASTNIQEESFLLQTSMILDDVLKLLQSSPELETIAKDSSGDALFMFLSQASFIPIESSGIQIFIELKSARSKFNVNTLMRKNGIISLKRVEALKRYLGTYMINDFYVDILLDNMGGIKEALPYNSEIFYENPTLFRNYIVSEAHLEDINDYFVKSFRENSLKNVDFDNLFYYSRDTNTSVDLNYATSEVWEMMLGCVKERAVELSAGGGAYKDLNSVLLNDEEKIELAKFSTSFFEPYIDVYVEVIEDEQSAKIRFEYDIKKKKGSNFVYEL